MRIPLLTLVMISGAACLPSSFDHLNRDRESVSNETTAGAGGKAGSGGGVSQSGRGGSSGAASAGRGGASGASGHAGTAARAGTGGSAGRAPEAGAGRGGSGASPMAGSGGSAAQCGDTKTDAKNCGQCGNVCEAASAKVSCQNGACVRACGASRGDCNGDLDFGAQGDGCETALSDDVLHCGGCNNRCERPAGSVAACEKQSCVAYRALVDIASPGANMIHGNAAGGNAYDESCGDGEVMVGIVAVADHRAMLGYATLCARASLSGTPAALTLSLAEPRMLNNLGVPASVDPSFTALRLQCAADEVVTTVNGGLWMYPTDPPAPNPSVKQLSLGCAKVAIDGDRRLKFTSSTSVSVGTDELVVATFADACMAGEVVTGFKGSAGSYIDSLQTQCAPLAVQLSPVGTVP